MTIDSNSDDTFTLLVKRSEVKEEHNGTHPLTVILSDAYNLVGTIHQMDLEIMYIKAEV